MEEGMMYRSQENLEVSKASEEVVEGGIVREIDEEASQVLSWERRERYWSAKLGKQNRINQLETVLSASSYQDPNFKQGKIYRELEVKVRELKDELNPAIDRFRKINFSKLYKNKGKDFDNAEMCRLKGNGVFYNLMNTYKGISEEEAIKKLISTGFVSDKHEARSVLERLAGNIIHLVYGVSSLDLEFKAIFKKINSSNGKTGYVFEEVAWSWLECNRARREKG